MNPPPDHTAWDRVATARRRCAVELADDELLPPPGFSTRVAARWAELRANERFQFWSRWSLRAAVGSLVAAFLVLLLTEGPPTRGLLFDVPAVDVPGLQAL